MPWHPLPALLIPPPYRRATAGLWGILVGIIILFSLMPDTGPPGVFHIDKLFHLAGYGALAGLPFAAFRTPRAVYGAALAMAPLGLALEFAQDFVPSRQADGLDMLANLAGVTIGMMLGPAFRALINRALASPAEDG